MSFLSLSESLTVEGYEIGPSFEFRIRASSEALGDCFHYSEDVIGEHPRGEVHGERGVTDFFHVYIIPSERGDVKPELAQSSGGRTYGKPKRPACSLAH